jgi:hypothetical protein
VFGSTSKKNPQALRRTAFARLASTARLDRAEGADVSGLALFGAILLGVLTVTVFSVDRSPHVAYPAIRFHDLRKRILLGQLDQLSEHEVDPDSSFAVLVVERAGGGRAWRRGGLEALADWLNGQTGDLTGPFLELRNTVLQALKR